MTSHCIFVIQTDVGSRIVLGLSEAPKRTKRDHTTYLKITLPSPPPGCADVDGFGMMSARQALQRLLRHDMKLVCYPYPKELRANAETPAVLQVNACGLTSKYVLQYFCESLVYP